MNSSLKNDMKEFVEQHKVLMITLLLTLIAAYGYEITNFTLSVDEELYINSGKDILVWIPDGRYGIALFNWIFLKFGMFGPFLSTFVSVILLYLSSILWCINFKKLIEKVNIHGAFYYIFSGLYCTLPFVMAELTVFSTFNIQINFGMMLIAYACYEIICMNDIKKDKLQLIKAFIAVFITFSMYQGFIAFYISAVTILVLVRIVKIQNIKIKEYINILSPYIIVFGLSIIAYYIFSKISYTIVPKRDYLSSFTSNEGIFAVFKNIVGRYMLGGGDYGFEVLKMTTYLYAVIAIYICCKKGGIITKLLILFTMLSSIIAPYSVFIILKSSNIQFRTLTGLLIFVGGIWFIALYILSTYMSKMVVKLIAVVFSVFSIVLIFNQCQSLNDLFYSDHVRFEHDTRVMGEIMQDVWEKFPDYEQKSIVFSGGMRMPLSNSIKRIQVIGMSIFEWESGNNGRLIPFLNSMGYGFYGPSGEQIVRARELGLTMPSWPAEGSIIEENNLIIINLRH